MLIELSIVFEHNSLIRIQIFNVKFFPQKNAKLFFSDNLDPGVQSNVTG
jgi:hypothetical protein